MCSLLVVALADGRAGVCGFDDCYDSEGEAAEECYEYGSYEVCGRHRLLGGVGLLWSVVGLLRLLWRYGSCSEKLSEFGDRACWSPFGHTFVPNEGVHGYAAAKELIYLQWANLIAVFGDVIFHNW